MLVAHRNVVALYMVSHKNGVAVIQPEDGRAVPFVSVRTRYLGELIVEQYEEVKNPPESWFENLFLILDAAPDQRQFVLGELPELLCEHGLPFIWQGNTKTCKLCLVKWLDRARI